MIININGMSNLDENTEAEYPSGLNGQTFSINGGFCFTLTFTSENDADNGQYCLIQLVTASERILENDSYIQTSNFNHLPVLDGDVMEDENLWYSNGTIIEVNAPGDFEIILSDDPQTSPAEGFYGPPNSLTVNEQFIIIFAKKLEGDNYEQLQKWTWGYNDNSNKVDGIWNNDNFNYNFGEIVEEIDLSDFNGSVRANNESQTNVEPKVIIETVDKK
ncbi:hypothetical protein [Flavivirga jejuensis]|uniref:Uncharacterized protein n=1 Tax=Flavivirga jejuensis TaxID=870487 RepID=A0ABT8WPN7_9FLAO|nr:hypothetical protein [Flavivirga jejuensis]MDO5975127.1 hypothetical protein [Flavivirga jejuensis]